MDQNPSRFKLACGACRFAKIAVIVAMAGAFTGCASIVGKTLYPVTFTSAPAGATVSVTNRAGQTVFSGQTPNTIVLKSGAGFWKGEDYTVTYTKPGYNATTCEIKRGVSGWYLAGNIVFGGLIGWLIVDPATGAMWTLEPTVSAQLPRATAAAPDNGGLRIANINDVPAHLRSRLVRVG